MATPMNPGWYPAPDGNGEQWWNGSGWSDTRRNADGTTPGLPGYQAAPPSDAAATNIPAPPPASTSSLSRVTQSNGASIVPFVFGIIGLTVFNLFGVFAIFIGIATFKSNNVVGKVLSGIGILLGAIGVILSVITFIQSGGRNFEDLIF